jgi:hypothetical protein
MLELKLLPLLIASPLKKIWMGNTLYGQSRSLHADCIYENGIFVV